MLVPDPKIAVPEDTMDAPMSGPITSGGCIVIRVVMISGSTARVDGGGSAPTCDPTTQTDSDYKS